MTGINHPEIDQADLIRQIKLERDGILQGETSLRKKLRQARENGQEHTTFYGSGLFKAILRPLTQAIEGFKQEASSGKPGKRHDCYRFLKGLDSDVLALLTSQCLIDRISAPASLQDTAIKIGATVELESRITAFQKKDERGVRTIAARVREDADNEGQKRRLWRNLMDKEQAAWDDDQWVRWSAPEKLKVGERLIDLALTIKGFIELGQVPNKHKGMNYIITAAPDLAAWIERQENRCELLAPEYYPTVIPPRPWTTPFDGGYYYIPKRPPLVKAHASNISASYLEDLSNLAGTMPMVYEAVNALQNTAYTVNTQVLETLREVWFNSPAVEREEILGLPTWGTLALPPCPICGAPLGETVLVGKGARRPAAREHECLGRPENYEILKDWKKKAKGVYRQNITAFSQRIRVSKTIWLAEKFKAEPRLYFPMQLDFRGRIYPVVNFLSPQSDDLGRSLLTFSEGKPLNSPGARRWFQIHGANCYGVDKVSFDDRVAWVKANADRILALAENPLDHLAWWGAADKPWQFLAWCFEFAGWKGQGDQFISRLPIHMDGSCNGLQIFSLMLRDEVGGRSTNVLPSDKPADIYQIVADKVTEALQDLAKSDRQSYRARNPEKQPADIGLIARLLLDLGINRKSTKRQVMVLPYGGTYQRCKLYTSDHLLERKHSQPDHPLFSGTVDLLAATWLLSGLIWDAIGDTVVAARQAMSYVQELTSTASKSGIPIKWTTPVGFVVSQAYRNFKPHRITTHIAGSRIQLQINSTDLGLDKHRQRNAVAPNFVHSLDAAALMLTIHKARQEGLTSFTTIHDSYGTLAADAPALAVSLREAFRDMFSGQGEAGVLARFRDEIAETFTEKELKKLPDFPPEGNLEVDLVLNSPYFFA